MIEKIIHRQPYSVDLEDLKHISYELMQKLNVYEMATMQKILFGQQFILFWAISVKKMLQTK